MKQELFKLTSDLFNKINQTAECHRKIDDYEHVYQFEIDGKQEFYIELNFGNIKVVEGVHKGAHQKVSLVKTDTETLRAILEGKLRPLDASKKGNWVIRARNYSGELLYVLLRIGREIAIEELLAGKN